MGRHPVEQHADAGGVEGVHQGLEPLGGAVAGGGRVESEGLVAPGTVEGMLRQGQEFHVGEAHLRHVGHQLLGELGVAEAPLARPPPGAGVHLVDGHRAAAGIAAGARLEPRRVPPGKGDLFHHPGGAGGRVFHGPPIGVGLEGEEATLTVQELVLVESAGPHPRHEQFEDARVAPPPHGVDPAVPLVPVPHHRRPQGVGCPEGEQGTRHPVHLPRMGAEPLLRALGGALVEPPEEFRWQEGAEGVGVGLQGAAVHLEAIGERPPPARQGELEESRGVEGAALAEQPPRAPVPHRHPRRPGAQDAHHPPSPRGEGMESQAASGIAVAPGHQRLHLGGGQFRLEHDPAPGGSRRAPLAPGGRRASPPPRAAVCAANWDTPGWCRAR
ncbi:MAG: hypothetical protein KatS3mg124_2471 [Porticoccaceae bacterium]|nr:MAG: hypothetical protein KatS3mg124_2471 [Porticoccaceae bacterium]